MCVCVCVYTSATEQNPGVSLVLENHSATEL